MITLFPPYLLKKWLTLEPTLNNERKDVQEGKDCTCYGYMRGKSPKWNTRILCFCHFGTLFSQEKTQINKFYPLFF